MFRMDLRYIYDKPAEQECKVVNNKLAMLISNPTLKSSVRYIRVLKKRTKKTNRHVRREISE